MAEWILVVLLVAPILLVLIGFAVGEEINIRRDQEDRDAQLAEQRERTIAELEEANLIGLLVQNETFIRDVERIVNEYEWKRLRST